jgi:hypothetical protein
MPAVAAAANIHKNARSAFDRHPEKIEINREYTMTKRKEEEMILQHQLRQQLLRGSIDRRAFLMRSLAAGLSAAGVGTVAKSGIG